MAAGSQLIGKALGGPDVAMKKAECDQLVEGVATRILASSGYQKQKAPRWIRATGHFFVEIGLPWSKGYYRLVIGIGCDLIPHAEGWKRPQVQKPGKLARNFLLPDSASWRQADRAFSHDPLLDAHFSLETVAGYFEEALRAVAKAVPWPVTKGVFLQEFERKRSSTAPIHFDAGVDYMITDYVIKVGAGADASHAAALLAAVYKSDSWKPTLDTAALALASLGD